MFDLCIGGCNDIQLPQGSFFVFFPCGFPASCVLCGERVRKAGYNKNMNKIKIWFKKHTFYKILAFVVIVLLAGYLIWLRQPVPIVSADAENARIGSTGINGNEAGKYITVRDRDVFAGTSASRYYLLSDEGEEKLIEELKKYSVQEYYDTPVAKGWQDSIIFPVDFEVDGITYDRYLEIGADRATSINVVFPTNGEGTAKVPVRPDVSYPTHISGAKDRRALYDSLLQIIQTYGTECELPDNSQDIPVDITIIGDN